MAPHKPRPPGRYTLEDGRPLEIIDLPDGTRVSTITDWDGTRIRIRAYPKEHRTSPKPARVTTRRLRALGGPEDRPQPRECEVCGQVLRPTRALRNGNMAPTLTCSAQCRQWKYLHAKAGQPVRREPTEKKTLPPDLEKIRRKVLADMYGEATVGNPTCEWCGAPLPNRKPGPGRPRKFCSVSCRSKVANRKYRKKKGAS